MGRRMCKIWGGVIYVVGLIISNGIVQKVDVTSTYSLCCGGKRKVTESKWKCDRSSKQVKLYHLQLHVFITFDTFLRKLGLDM